MSFHKYYQHSTEERRRILINERHLTPDAERTLTEPMTLSQTIADQMIENQLTIHGVPMGLVPDILVDGVSYSVPMATEEPSVIAAASNAARIITAHGGFHTTQDTRHMIGEVAVANATVPLAALQEELMHHQDTWLKMANDAHPSIVKRGGGVKRIWVDERYTPDRTQHFTVFYLEVDTLEAMGANILNTMLEALRTPIAALTNGDVLMAILSNYATASLVTATCTLPFTALSKADIPGETVAQRIAQASDFARADIYRATTHNKGIMNGIDAVVLATGNDWRAIEAGAHAYATHTGHYQPLATWHVDGDTLIGTITLPLPVGTVGGSINIHPTASLAHDILGRPNARALASIITSIGLAQNFAAIRALVTDGIQKGHMKLQAKSLAITVGATPQEVPTVVTQLLTQPHMNQQTAQQVLDAIRNAR